MVREAFEEQLNELRGQLLELTRKAGSALAESVRALKDRDLEAGRRLIEDDEEINHLCFLVEEACLNLIATQQPVARDLRLLFSVMQIAVELERIGDYAKGISKISDKIGEEPILKPLVDIPRMCDIATSMLDDALKAFLDKDPEQARRIPPRDVEMDLLDDQIHRELLTHLMSKPQKMEQAMMLMWVAHNLERAADRVINMCERIIFTTTGEVVDLG
jgi:phosphate transport system protein